MTRPDLAFAFVVFCFLFFPIENAKKDKQNMETLLLLIFLKNTFTHPGHTHCLLYDVSLFCITALGIIKHTQKTD